MAASLESTVVTLRRLAAARELPTASLAEVRRPPPEASPPIVTARDGCYSARLSRPFIRVLKKHPACPPYLVEGISSLEALDLDERIPIPFIHQTLEAAVSVLGDPHLGLKAARERTVGDSGALDYAIHSASTVRHALEAAARYIRLVNDALVLYFEVVGDLAVLRFENHVTLPRPAMDFQIGGIFRALTAAWASIPSEEVVVSFTCAPEGDVSEYASTFTPATVKFGESYNGYALPAKYLDTPLKTADSLLHDVIRRHAEKTIAELPPVQQLTARVRQAIADELSGGNAGIANVAKRLRFSTRTLARKLEQEGTTFSLLLDDMRRRLALRHVASNELELSEIAFLLGFSQTTAFHRAFKRWTGDTPLHFRRSRKSSFPGK
jgi:AraC-like DNA-binding protein